MAKKNKTKNKKVSEGTLGGCGIQDSLMDLIEMNRAWLAIVEGAHLIKEGPDLEAAKGEAYDLFMIIAEKDLEEAQKQARSKEEILLSLIDDPHRQIQTIRDTSEALSDAIAFSLTLVPADEGDAK